LCGREEELKCNFSEQKSRGKTNSSLTGIELEVHRKKFELGYSTQTNYGTLTVIFDMIFCSGNLTVPMYNNGELDLGTGSQSDKQSAVNHQSAVNAHPATLLE